MTTESPSYSTIEQAFSLGNGQDSLEGTISGFDQYSVLLTDAHGNQQLVYKAKISTIAMHSGRPQVSIQRARKPRVSMAPRPHGAPSRYDDNQGGSSEQ